MSLAQVQIKISLSEQLNALLKSKAQRIGVPVTQLVKYIIIKEVEKEDYPVFVPSERVEKKTEKALREIDKAIEVNDLDEFFKNL